MAFSPAITPDVRAKIFGLNGARVYGIDPAATRYAVAEDDVDRLRRAYLYDRRLVPVPDPRWYEGPRTRRAYYAHAAREEHEREQARAVRFRKS